MELKHLGLWETGQRGSPVAPLRPGHQHRDPPPASSDPGARHRAHRHWPPPAQASQRKKTAACPLADIFSSRPSGDLESFPHPGGLCSIIRVGGGWNGSLHYSNTPPPPLRGRESEASGPLPLLEAGGLPGHRGAARAGAGGPGGGLATRNTVFPSLPCPRQPGGPCLTPAGREGGCMALQRATRRHRSFMEREAEGNHAGRK